MPYEVCHEFLSRKISRRLRVLYIKLNGQGIQPSTLPVSLWQLVSSLKKGICNVRPPTPRYNYIMDVEQVLKHLITYPSNSKLNKTRNVINSSRNHIKFRDQERRYRVFGTINMRFL